MKLKSLLLMVLMFLMLPVGAFADSPYEEFHAAYGEIASAALHDTIGVLTINATWSWEPSYHVDDLQIPLGEKTHVGLVPGGRISLQNETRSLSSYGYSGTGSFRYPITEISGEYCRIIIDAKADRRVWVNSRMLGAMLENGVQICLFDAMKDVQVDIFVFTSSRKKKIYDQPAKDSKYRIIDDKTWPALEAAETKDGFVRLVVREGEPGENQVKKTIGWARIRDNEGFLSLWIVSVDEC